MKKTAKVPLSCSRAIFQCHAFLGTRNLRLKNKTDSPALTVPNLKRFQFAFRCRGLHDALFNSPVSCHMAGLRHGALSLVLCGRSV